MPYYDWDNHRDTCEHCGVTLSGRQERWCSERCRQAGRSAAKRPFRTVNCELCGEPFVTQNSRKKRCDLATGMDPSSPRYTEAHAERDAIADAGPKDLCWELQEAEDAVKSAAVDTRDFPECAHCGAEDEYAGTGRHRKYCSDRCRVYAHRAQKGRKTPPKAS